MHTFEVLSPLPAIGAKIRVHATMEVADGTDGTVVGYGTVDTSYFLGNVGGPTVPVVLVQMDANANVVAVGQHFEVLAAPGASG